MLSDDDIKTYLSAALDQEACKDTLRAALVSRVDSLHRRGVASQTLICNLECIGEERYQINDDVIFEVVALIRREAASGE